MTGTKQKLEAAYASVDAVLDRSSLSFAEKNVVTETLKQQIKERCSAESAMAAFDAYLKETHPEVYKEFMANYYRSKIYQMTYMAKMREKCPTFGK